MAITTITWLGHFLMLSCECCGFVGPHEVLHATHQLQWVATENCNSGSSCKRVAKPSCKKLHPVWIPLLEMIQMQTVVAQTSYGMPEVKPSSQTAVQLHWTSNKLHCHSLDHQSVEIALSVPCSRLSNKLQSEWELGGIANETRCIWQK